MKVLAVYVPFHDFLSEFLLLKGLHFIDCWDWWVRVLSQGSAETSYSYAINGTCHGTCGPREVYKTALLALVS